MGMSFLFEIRYSSSLRCEYYKNSEQKSRKVRLFQILKMCCLIMIHKKHVMKVSTVTISKFMYTQPNTNRQHVMRNGYCLTQNLTKYN